MVKYQKQAVKGVGTTPVRARPTIGTAAEDSKVFCDSAMRAAGLANQTPYIYRDGNRLALVTDLVRHKDGTLRGMVHQYQCDSAGRTRSIQAVLTGIIKEHPGSDGKMMLDVAIATVMQSLQSTPEQTQQNLDAAETDLESIA